MPIAIILAILKVIPDIMEMIQELRKQPPLPMPIAVHPDLLVLEAVEGIVSGIDADHPDWPGWRKRDYALRAIQIELEKKGISRKESEINLLIEIYCCRLAQNRAGALTSEKGDIHVVGRL